MRYLLPSLSLGLWFLVFKLINLHVLVLCRRLLCVLLNHCFFVLLPQIHPAPEKLWSDCIFSGEKGIDSSFFFPLSDVFLTVRK